MKISMFATMTALGVILATPALAQQTSTSTSTSTSTRAYPPAAQTVPADTAAADPTNDGSQLSDVIVTAQRRAESVQNVPVAVSAFTADELQSRGVNNTLELGQYVPNLIAQNNTGIGSANAYYLRGLGNTETIATFDPPVGTYVDDIYIARQNANNLNLFDVERVEVLRGPQGTLFGKNTTGGAISVVLRQPGKTLGGYAEIGYGTYNKKLARGSIDLPIAPTLSIKISGYYENDDGYTRDTITNQRLNDDDGWGARLGVRGELSDRVTWNASYAHIVAKGENVLNFVCNPANPSDCSGRFSTTGYSETPGAANFAAVGVSGAKAGYGLGNYAASDLVTSNLEFGFGKELTVNLITGLVVQRQHYGLDFYDGRGAPSLANPFPAVTGNPRGGFVILDTGYTEQFSQEVKLSGHLFDGLLDYVGGFFYLHEYNRTDYADVFANVLLLDDKILRNTTEDFAGYVQADLNVTRQIKLTAGVRYTDETKSLEFHDNRAICNAGALLATCFENRNLVAANGVAIPQQQTARVWTPRFAANFKPSDDILLYASATRGFKSGGWNARSTAVNLVLPFDPEKVWSYETGIKSEFLNRHVRLNLTGYIENVSNLQTLSAFVSTTGALTFLTRNFANYVNRGIEAELTVIPTRGLNLYATLGYQKDHYNLPNNAPAFDQYGVQSVAAQQVACRAQLAQGRVGGTSAAPACAAGIVTAQGNIATPVRTPDFSLSGGTSYALPLGSSGLTLVPSVNASFHTDQEVATSNLTLYTGAITGTAASGVGTTTYLGNPNGGSEIAGSLSKAALLINASVALNGPDKRWSLTAECSNCTNKDFFQSSLGNYDYLNTPRTVLVRARYNF